MAQKTFSDIKFSWTPDGWYKTEKVDALKARREFVKELKKQGYKPICSSLGGQLRRVGGIGTGKPDIEWWEKCYMVTW
jgi:hypothetical protein